VTQGIQTDREKFSTVDLLIKVTDFSEEVEIFLM
jgi:hypothetical protein